MCLKQKPVALMLSTAIIVALSNNAFAKPVHHRHHARGHVRAMAVQMQASAHPSLRDDRFPFLSQVAQATVTGPRAKKGRRVIDAVAPAAAGSFAAAGSLGSDPLITEARRYIGTNPTGRGSLWCGAFMDMVLRHTGHPGGGNLATAYAHYGRRVSGPQVGAIAVMGRKGGGHVGIVTGFDPHGNPIIISGNHNHEVAEAVYPRGRIFAYVLPN